MEANLLKFKVLEGLQIILKFVEFYPSDGVFFGVRIPFRVIFRGLFFTLILFQLTTIWLCMDGNWDLKIVSGPLCFLCGGFQILIIYFDMLTSKAIIIETMDLLQQLVQKSKLSSFLSFDSK